MGPLVEESAEAGLAADGGPLAEGGAEGDSIVHPMRGRIDLTITATGSLKPGVAVHYSGHYIGKVFKTCEGRKRVPDIVWCLEEAVHKSTHRRVFPRTSVPDTAKHEAERPPSWHWADIRSTWLRNLAKEGR